MMYLDLLFLIAILLLNAAGLLLFPSSAVCCRSPLLLPLGAISLFFAPGYLLLAALYPTPRSLPPPQRFLGAFGLSAVVSGLLLLLAAYTAGFTTHSAFIALLAWSLPLSLLTALRRRHLHPPRPAFPLTRPIRPAGTTPSKIAIRHSPFAILTPSRMRNSQFGSRRPFPLIPYSLFVILFISLARLIAVSTSATPQYTEFYLLGPGRLLGGLPERVAPGATPEIFIGIANHEGRPVDYRVQIGVSGLPARPLATLSLQDGASWEEKIALPRLPGPDLRKITLTLHKDAEPSPYRSVYLWLRGADLNVAAQPATSTSPAKNLAMPDRADVSPHANPAPPPAAAGLPAWLTNAAMLVLAALLAIKELANASEDPRCHRLSRRLSLPIMPLFMLFVLIIFSRLATALQ